MLYAWGNAGLSWKLAGKAITRIDTAWPHERRATPQAFIVADGRYAPESLLLERPWGRAEEDQSDALAYDLTASAGYRPAVAADAVFGRLNAEYDLQRELGQHLMATAQTALQAGLSEQSMAAVRQGGTSNLWDNMRGPLMRVGRDRLMQVAVGYLGQRHRTPEARTRGVRDYAARAYPGDVAQPELQTDWLDDVRSNAEFQEARAVLAAMQEAKSLETTDLDGAVAALRPALATRYRSAVVANAAARLYGLAYLQRCVNYEEDQLRSACTVAALGWREGDQEMTPEARARINPVLRDAEAQSTMGGDMEGMLRGLGSLLNWGS